MANLNKFSRGWVLCIHSREKVWGIRRFFSPFGSGAVEHIYKDIDGIKFQFGCKQCKNSYSLSSTVVMLTRTKNGVTTSTRIKFFYLPLFRYTDRPFVVVYFYFILLLQLVFSFVFYRIVSQLIRRYFFIFHHLKTPYFS